jgi:hypothetical protein
MSLWKRLFGKSVTASSEAEAGARNSEPLPDFPFPLVAVPGREGIAAWKKYQALWRDEGASAVMLGDAKEVERVAENVEMATDSPEEILQRASSIDLQKFFEQRRSGSVEEGETLDEGEWPEGRVGQSELGAHLDVLSRQPKKTVYLAKIPTAKVWEIPAYLRLGNWNDCPAPEYHVAVLRHWAEIYGVEIYAATGDVVECTAARPPKTPEAAMTLAREQYFYCSDIVDQGTESVAVLGATLLNSPAWYFWWD